MKSLDDLLMFLAVMQHGSFRNAARQRQRSTSSVSESIARLEKQLGVRLFNRTTRSITPTDAGAALAARLRPALAEVRQALDVTAGFRDGVRGRLRLNVPGAVMRDILPPITARFMKTHPDIRMEIMIDDTLVDIIAAGCDAGIRYGETLAQDMIAVPIGPRLQFAAVAASPDYLREHGTPEHPRDLLTHSCIRHRFPNGVSGVWEFDREGEVVTVDPEPRLVIGTGTGAADAMIDAAVKGLGIIGTFANWLEPHFADGSLVPVLRDWWDEFEGPFLYYPSRRYVPAPLRAFIDLVKQDNRAQPVSTGSRSSAPHSAQDPS